MFCYGCATRRMRVCNLYLQLMSFFSPIATLSDLQDPYLEIEHPSLSSRELSWSGWRVQDASLDLLVGPQSPLWPPFGISIKPDKSLGGLALPTRIKIFRAVLARDFLGTAS